jgi:fructose-bisphosphate aldolase class II
MSLSLKQMRANCDKARAAMDRAKHERFALGAFNLDNQDILKAVMQAAKNKNAPLMVEVSHGEVEALGLENIRDMVDNYKEEYGTEVYINLDHSPSVAAAIAGIEAGYEFIHTDISQARKDATVEEIITETRQIVDSVGGKARRCLGCAR